MWNCFRKWACGAFLFAALAPVAQATEKEPSIRVLFLGDSGHHHPEDRFKQARPVLAPHGIKLEYTASLDDLTRSKLVGFDCLLIYANRTKISPAQEQALMEFVEQGGGLAAIHCASYCFLNSPKYIELVGAQFKSHGTGVFKETFVNPAHPVLRGRAPIESWDETYVHIRHNTNRIVLSERRDATNAEPYTWVREAGRGRVFYTAWGHDERTWSNPEFQGLLENGIRWASEKSPSLLRAHSGLKPPEYTSSPEALPNYVPGAKWGTQAEPIRTMQKPLSPEESTKHLVTPPDFKVSLFAAEPDIAKPIWMAWDERGRLWIAETVDYPNNMQPPGEGHDRIKICEDTDGDGRADKFTVFADKLSVPTGFVFARGGIIVVHSGKTEFLKASSGGDGADIRETLFSGWGTKDTHAGPSNLRYGFDNWIWGTVGYSGFDGTVGGKHLRFGQGIYRFKPDGSALEFVRSTDNNTWGLGLSEDNIIFGSTANGDASVYMPIANRYYEAVNGWSASRLETIADSQEIFPITTKIRQVDWHGKYTAGAGSALYTARSFPREYWNQVQFVAEPTGHLLGKFHLEPRGADFAAHNGRSFLASDDEWTAPICAEVGPDGALWVIDWYNYIVQHNPTPNGFRTGKGNAYETGLRDKTHGRIYRVAYQNSTPAKPVSLATAGGLELVQTLKSDNLLWRMIAQRLLVERGKTDVVADLCQLLRDQSSDELELNAPAIHALWTLKGLRAINGNSGNVLEAVTEALGHPSPGVRKAAVQVLPPESSSADMILRRKLLEDQDARVRLATLLALSEMPRSEAVGPAVFAMLEEPRNSEGKWILDAATCAAARHDLSFLRAALAGSPDQNTGKETPSGPNLLQIPSNTSSAGGLGKVVQRVARHYASAGPIDTVIAALTVLKGAPPQIATAVLEGLASGWPRDVAPPISQQEGQVLASLMSSLPEGNRSELLMLARKWRREDIFGGVLADTADSLKIKIADLTASNEQRIMAAKELIQLQDQPEITQCILNQINPLIPPELAVGFVGAVAEGRNPETARLLLGRCSQFTPSVRRAAISELLRRLEWTAALLDEIEKGQIRWTELAAEQWSQIKLSQNKALAERAAKLSSAGKAITTDRAEIVNKLLPLAKENGDPTRGKEVFVANCLVCHTFNGTGGKVGPELTGIGARDRTEILIDILDPNRSVEANYRMWIISTKDDESYSGRLETETQTTVELLDTTGKKHVIQRKDIESMRGSELSIMPNGFETLPPTDLKALLAYLTETR